MGWTVEALAASWIEINTKHRKLEMEYVEALAASWIEIIVWILFVSKIWSKPLRLRGLKYCTLLSTLYLLSRSPCGFVD